MKDVHTAVNYISELAIKLENVQKFSFTVAFSDRFISEVRFFEEYYSLYGDSRTDLAFEDILRMAATYEDMAHDIAFSIKTIENRIPELTEEMGLFGVCGQHGYIGMLYVLEYLSSKDDRFIELYIEKFFDIVDYISQEMRPESSSSTDEFVLESAIFKKEYGRVLDLINHCSRLSATDVINVSHANDTKSLYQRWLL